MTLWTVFAILSPQEFETLEDSLVKEMDEDVIPLV
ncbi:Uncharacterised protein [Chlamydia trachomatis]|nr:Uncharacterised protein [Chlamydia trachomatis]